MNTKPIQIFIAATPELENELYSIHDLIQQVNKHFRARGYELQAVDGDSADFVQDLHESDLCLALYCNQFGSFKQEHLEDAYKELCENRNPKKIYIYFKNTDAITEELRIFRDSFSEKYGHFYCHFENVDTMKLNFLLQCEGYITKTGQESLVKVRYSKIEINGEKVADLTNLPFVQNNKSFQKLLQDIKEAQTAVLQEPDNTDLWQKIHDLQEERSKREEAMLRMAQFITKQSTETTSERFAEAMRLFEAGETKKVNEILDDDIIAQEVADRHRTIDTARDARKGLEMNIKEWQLKIENVQTEMQKGWFEQVVSLYDKCVDAARGYIEDEDLAKLLLKYGDFVCENKQYHRIGNLYDEALAIRRRLAAHNPEAYESDVATTLNNFAILHSNLQQYAQAEEEYKEALAIYRRLAAHNPEAYESDVAMTLNNLANLHSDLQQYVQAKEEYTEALAIHRRLTAHNPEAYESDVATTLHNLGVLYKDLQQYAQAEEEYKEALTIRRRLASHSPEAYESRVATTLNNLANLHSALQQYVPAEEEYKEALAIYRTLAAHNPKAYESDVADTLFYLALLYYTTGKTEDSHTTFQDVLQLYEKLAPSNSFYKENITIIREILAEF